MRRLEEQRLSLQERIEREIAAREKESTAREGVEKNLEVEEKKLNLSSKSR